VNLHFFWAQKNPLDGGLVKRGIGLYQAGGDITCNRPGGHPRLEFGKD
jgi:hypothetical protein